MNRVHHKVLGENNCEIRWVNGDPPSREWEAIFIEFTDNGMVEITLANNNENIDFFVAELDIAWSIFDLAKRVESVFERLFAEALDFYPLTVAALICRDKESKYNELKELCTNNI